MSRLAKLALLVAFVFVSIVALGAISSPKVSAQTDNKAVIQKFVDSYNAALKGGDAAEWLDLFAPEYTSENAPAGMAITDYLKANLTQIQTAFPDGQLEIKDLVAEGDKVAMYSVFTGTNTGSLGGLTPTGSKVSFKLMDIFTLKDGKIIKDDSVSDNVALYQQLGFTITPPQAGTPSATDAAGTPAATDMATPEATEAQ